MRPKGRPHLSPWQTKDKSSAWSIAGGACLLWRMERAILLWPGVQGTLGEGRDGVWGVSSWAWASRTLTKSAAATPSPRPPLTEESGFNFLVRPERRRKWMRRRRRKEWAEVLMQSAGICHSAHSPLTTRGSPSCKQPMIYGHQVNSCGRNQPWDQSGNRALFLAGDRACIFLIHAKLLCTAISSVLI